MLTIQNITDIFFLHSEIYAFRKYFSTEMANDFLRFPTNRLILRNNTIQQI